MKVVFVLLALTICVSATPKFHRVKNTKSQGIFVYQDVVFDEEENYAMITTTPQHSGKASVNLHDISTGFSAVKDINDGSCFVFQANHTLKDLKDRVIELDHQMVTSGMKSYTFNCERDPMSNVFLRNLAGEKIAAFCEDYTSKLVNLAPTRLSVREQPQIPNSLNDEYFCILCLFGSCS